VVVNIDNRLDAEVLADYSLKIPYVGPSNREGAKLVADHVLTNLGSDTTVAILEGISSAHNAIQRRMGFEDAVREAGMKVVTSQSASWDQTKAAQLTAAILSQHPDLDVILAANDNMALGAASAVKLADLERSVIIAGFDNISAIHPLIESGAVTATVDQFGGRFAVFGIELALNALEGNTKLVDRKTPVELITIAQLDAL
jgi:ribose transport system substrate-binding protein